MHVSSIVVRGYGSWGTVYRVPTLGYGIGEIVHGPYCVTSTQCAVAGAEVQYAISGADAVQFAVNVTQSQIAVSGADELQVATSGPTSVQGACG